MEKHTIIIVEDDEITSLNLKLSLEKHGYGVICLCKNTIQAVEALDTYKPNVVIIDISLQESNDGIELAKTIKTHYSIPFIYLTSYSDDDMISQAIKTEPYGYIVKPFDPSSLHATIQMAIFKFNVENERYEEIITSKIDEENLEKLLYAKRKSDKPIVTFGQDYHIDISKDEIFYNNEKIKLTKKESAILRLLVAKLGHIITFNQAIDYVWQESGATENSIRTLVWRLRNKLPTDIIKNASGIGYYLENN
ncbi:MAG: transcriptional regulator [Sulfurimonas sp. RIFOXYD12_FULL_33_39]|uniref:response regulator transcription factor n=1 Tax=unclassified Sulfurimonas TaxID=2623549 RepID=UPI0008D760D8|nr:MULTISPECIES: response regulator [unclassified Sulfurimonas]OHE07117.1 MAG: transcriptional regulator [Sulfurimonas sp. RIFCSPLOWO2_12_FULL_34_6]OHE09108.1 MAG: transcriptional regulator [Sulfurimonas sp. RIFOXYD12_FULL_33_39]OHE14425.1 MAG: transcriptional regulator [Sulfurimonas sp. RIFOXYD2_FULL_34_21]DAB28495.1 MAG TPA: transcriptional regulator [Sulfurimonas sp. UBA10385]